jgi:ABC-type oligopeptide transport system substrate-binding subunit
LGRGALADAIPRLKSGGMQIVTNVYPHDWPYLLNFTRGPFKDLRVRQAANYAINRPDVVDMLGGTAIPEHDVVPPSMAYYGHPPTYDYDPKKARALLGEAGCLPCKVTFGISTSGSGQMQPLPMRLEGDLEPRLLELRLDQLVRSSTRFLVLPVITLAMIPIGILSRTTRAAVAEVRNQDFVQTLRAKGLSEWAVTRHVLKNSLPQVMAVMGLQFGYLIGGSILVETVFT